MSLSIESINNQPLPSTLPRIDGYRILKTLGKGEKGEVFLLEDASGKKFAAKHYFLKDSLAEHHRHIPEYGAYIDSLYDPNGVCRLANIEYEKSQLLQHPHIMTCKQILIENDAMGKKNTYLLMEFIDGKTLRENPPFLGLKSSLIQSLQLIDALKFAFEKGMIHRDLWSDNIMIDAQGQLKIIDIDSFEDIEESADEDETQEEYAHCILNMVGALLQSNGVENSQAQEVKMALSSLLHEFAELNQQPITSKSPKTYFIPLLEQMAAKIKTSISLHKESYELLARV